MATSETSAPPQGRRGPSQGSRPGRPRMKRGRKRTNYKPEHKTLVSFVKELKPDWMEEQVADFCRERSWNKEEIKAGIEKTFEFERLSQQPDEWQQVPSKKRKPRRQGAGRGGREAGRGRGGGRGGRVGVRGRDEYRPRGRGGYRRGGFRAGRGGRGGARSPRDVDTRRDASKPRPASAEDKPRRRQRRENVPRGQEAPASPVSAAEPTSPAPVSPPAATPVAEPAPAPAPAPVHKAGKMSFLAAFGSKAEKPKPKPKPLLPKPAEPVPEPVPEKLPEARDFTPQPMGEWAAKASGAAPEPEPQAPAVVEPEAATEAPGWEAPEEKVEEPAPAQAEPTENSWSLPPAEEPAAPTEEAAPVEAPKEETAPVTEEEVLAQQLQSVHMDQTSPMQKPIGHTGTVWDMERERVEQPVGISGVSGVTGEVTKKEELLDMQNPSFQNFSVGSSSAEPAPASSPATESQPAQPTEQLLERLEPAPSAPETPAEEQKTMEPVMQPEPVEQPVLETPQPSEPEPARLASPPQQSQPVVVQMPISSVQPEPAAKLVTSPVTQAVTTPEFTATAAPLEQAAASASAPMYPSYSSMPYGAQFNAPRTAQPGFAEQPMYYTPYQYPAGAVTPQYQQPFPAAGRGKQQRRSRKDKGKDSPKKSFQPQTVSPALPNPYAPTMAPHTGFKRDGQPFSQPAPAGYPFPQPAGVSPSGGFMPTGAHGAAPMQPKTGFKGPQANRFKGQQGPYPGPMMMPQHMGYFPSPYMYYPQGSQQFPGQMAPQYPPRPGYFPPQAGGAHFMYPQDGSYGTPEYTHTEFDPSHSAQGMDQQHYMGTGPTPSPDMAGAMSASHMPQQQQSPATGAPDAMRPQQADKRASPGARPGQPPVMPSYYGASY